MATLLAGATSEKLLLVSDGTNTDDALSRLVEDFGHPAPHWSPWQVYDIKQAGGCKGLDRYTFCTERKPVGGAA